MGAMLDVFTKPLMGIKVKHLWFSLGFVWYFAAGETHKGFAIYCNKSIHGENKKMTRYKYEIMLRAWLLNLAVPGQKRIEFLDTKVVLDHWEAIESGNSFDYNRVPPKSEWK